MAGQHPEQDPGRDTRLWHPFAQMSVTRSAEFVVERGKDVWIWDTDGNRYLDATASLWYSNIGHGRPEIREAVTAQMAKLEAYSVFNDIANPPALELASRLADLAPDASPRILLGSGGGDGIDTAAKLVRRYWHECGKPERSHLITRRHGYHGTHGFGTSLAGIPANRIDLGPLIEQVSIVDFESVDALGAEIESLGAENVAAFFCEPVIGAGGVYPPPDGYMEGIAEVCRETGVLLVIDAVICGFGRLGTWFGVERWPGVDPDMIVFAKGVTSGYLPLGGVVVSERVAAPFWENVASAPFRHGATYAGHPASCAAALANLDILENEGLIARGMEMERPLFDALAPLTENPLVSEVRGGTGLMAAVALEPRLLELLPDAPMRLCHAARRNGVLVRPLGAGVATSPPLTVQSEHLELLAESLSTALGELRSDADTAGYEPSAQEPEVNG